MVYQNRGTVLALGDQISAKYRLTEIGWRSDHAVVVPRHGCHGLESGLGQLADECRFDGLANVSQVIQFRGDSDVVRRDWLNVRPYAGLAV